MDPFISSAIITGLANLSKDAIKDGYDALKSALNKRFGANSDLLESIDKLEKDPSREDRIATVRKEFELTQDNDDQEILALARDLLDKIKDHSGNQQAFNQSQHNDVSNNTIGGNLEFKPVQNIN
jgi:hypothetical protein